MTKLFSFLHDEAGVTAIEYGLIAAGIGVAIVFVVTRCRHQAHKRCSRASQIHLYAAAARKRLEPPLL